MPIDDEAEEFLRSLAAEYLPTRYPGARSGYDEDEAREYLRQTQEFFAWSRQQLS